MVLKVMLDLVADRIAVAILNRIAVVSGRAYVRSLVL